MEASRGDGVSLLDAAVACEVTRAGTIVLGLAAATDGNPTWADASNRFVAHSFAERPEWKR